MSGGPYDPSAVAGLPGRPTWRRLSECPRCVAYRPNLVRTALTALVVGSVLFLINHLGPVLAGRAGTSAWVGTGVSFVVPFLVANLGLLVASRRVDAAVGPQPAARRLLPAPTWSRPSECLACVVHRPHLSRTVATALVVGTLYFVVNQLDVVARGDATSQVWLATGLTYLVPFVVSNIGLLVGARRPNGPSGGRPVPRG